MTQNSDHHFPTEPTQTEKISKTAMGSMVSPPVHGPGNQPELTHFFDSLILTQVPFSRKTACVALS